MRATHVDVSRLGVSTIAVHTTTMSSTHYIAARNATMPEAACRPAVRHRIDRKYPRSVSCPLMPIPLYIITCWVIAYISTLTAIFMASSRFSGVS